MTEREQMRLIDAAREAVDAYDQRFSTSQNGGRWFGPIDTEMTELRKALKPAKDTDD